VCISGGEPLLDDNGERAFYIVKTLREKGIKNIFLSTNGTNFLEIEKKRGISKYLDKLSMPLDGFDSKSICCNGRSAESFETIIEVLKYFLSLKNQGEVIPDIKISTVLTANNIHDYSYWENIHRIIKKYPVKLWKIYDFIPENRGEQNRDSLQYDAKDFDAFADRIDLLKSNETHLSIEIAKRSSRSDIYFIIRPDGKVIIPKDVGERTEEIIIGNLLEDDNNKILDQWNNKIDYTKCGFYSIGRNIKERIESKNDDLADYILSSISGDTLYSEAEIIEFAAKHFEGQYTKDDIKLKLFSLKEGVIPTIREIVPIINLSRIGFQVFLINLYFARSLDFSADTIAEHICEHSAVAWCARYEIVNNDNEIVFRISIFAKDIYACANYIEDIVSPFGSIFKSKSIDYVPEKVVAYDKIFGSESTSSELDGRTIVYKREDRRLHLKKREKQVLLSASTFRRDNKLSLETLLAALQRQYRGWMKANSFKKLKETIDALREKEIINMFQVVVNEQKLGFITYIVLYDLQPILNENLTSLLRDFEFFVKSLYGITHINLLKTGDWDADIEMKIRTPGELAYVDTKIRERFGERIRDRKSMKLIKEYKFTFLIPIVLEAIKTM